MNKKIIVGIQQVGIGLADAREAWKWYRRVFGMDINVFEDTATAKLMLHYTNGQHCDRYAALALNMEGGGGFEVWQHTGMEPQPPVFNVKLGDTGIFICKMKTRDIHSAFEKHKAMNVRLLGGISTDPAGLKHYYLKDPYDNIFEVIGEQNHFMKQSSVTGGVVGTVIGVSDMESAMRVYRDILQYTDVVYDQTAVFDDYRHLAGGNEQYRRVLLKHKPRKGPFSRVFGPTQIELVQPLERRPRRIYDKRIWGELGFIHLCFDIIRMNSLQKECEDAGFPFTVNSANSFDMGSAAGHFAYISDPDGTPIEFVETHKLPIIEKLGWYLDLRKRNPEKPLPDWILKSLRFSRVKD